MLAIALIALGIVLPALLALERLAPRLGLLDHPRGHKTHAQPTPVVGGLAIAIGLFFTWPLSATVDPGLWIGAGCVSLVALGVLDDRHDVGARAKLAAQAIIVTLVFLFDGGVLRNLGELLPGVAVGLAWFSLPLTVFAMLGMINAINMLDGVDGLAGKVALAAFGWFAVSAWLIGDTQMLASSLVIATALAVFLAFNAPLPGRRCARVFMGDTGSMLLGFLLTWTAIEITQRPGGIPPVTALWICALPILDTTAVTVRRIALGRPPMAAGRDHLHHLLRARGASAGRTALAEAGIGAAAGLVGVCGWRLGAADWVMFALFVIGALAYIGLFHAAWDAQEAAQGAVAPEAPADAGERAIRDTVSPSPDGQRV